MKYLKEFFSFVNEEWSKNEPIPEILDAKRNTAIFVIGAPGIGKSYFVKNYIDTKNPTFKDFSTDDVSLLYTKDPNVYYTGKVLPDGSKTKNASELNLNRMQLFMETGQNFIYDTTGSGKEFTDRGYEHIKEIFDNAKMFGYKIIFIHLLSTLQTSIDQDKLRDRHVDPQYIKWAYAKQQGGEIDGQKVEGNIQRYKALNPDAYYLVTSIDKKYKFYKFIDGKLAVRKGDRYLVKESIDNSSEIKNIVDCMLDFTDDGYNIFFMSPIGNMTYQQYLDGQGDFHPVFKPNESLIRSQFTIRVYQNDKFRTYDDFVKIVEEMQVVIARLEDDEWKLADFDVNVVDSDPKNGIKPIFKYIDYKFIRQDQKIEVDRKFDLKNFKTDFVNKTGMNIEEITDHDDMVYIEFSSNYYDGEIPSDLDDRFSKICDRWGFTEYEYHNGASDVAFHWDEV
jgi:predicted kinase